MEIIAKYGSMLFEKTEIGLALCRMNGDLLNINSAYAAITGRTIEEVLTLSYWELTPEKFEGKERFQLESLENTGRYGPYEKEYIHANGQLIPVRLSGQIVEIDNEQYIWSSVEDITESKLAEAELKRLYNEVEQLSLMDGLTGIANRRMFDQAYHREWARAKRDNSPLSLIMLDIDFFKEYNDFYGHTQGDECLKQISKVLSRLTQRATDLIGRYGGEEFVFILPEMTELNAQNFTQQCFNAIKDLRIPHKLSTIDDVVTVSAGVSTIVPLANMEPSFLIESADKLLYQAKKNGRNRFEYLKD